MMHTDILWIATFAYAAHIAEEFAFDWKEWATNTLKFPVDWSY